MIRDDWIVGASVGFSWDDVKLDSKGSKVTSTSPLASIYASYKVTDQIFIDGLIGYGEALLKNTRWVEADQSLVRGTRKAASYFASLAATISLKKGAVKVDPFIQGDFTSSRLCGYSEAGSVGALSYDVMRTTAASISSGLTASYDIERKGGVYTPFTKLEYKRSDFSYQTQKVIMQQFQGRLNILNLKVRCQLNLWG